LPANTAKRIQIGVRATVLAMADNAEQGFQYDGSASTAKRKLNDAIKVLHKFGQFAFKQNIVERTTAYLRQFTTLSREVVRIFVQLFIKFRMNRLNQELRELARKKMNKKSKCEKKSLNLPRKSDDETS
jgi:hypothetical protein